MKDFGLSNDLQEILTYALNEMKAEAGEKFDLKKVNLAELQRRTGITRKKLRRLKRNNFKFMPHGNTGRKAEVTVMSGYTGIVDDLLKNRVNNSEVIYDRIKPLGYSGSVTTVRKYVEAHRDLIPAERQAVSPQGNRGRRYETGPGESYQMDWGFVNVTNRDGSGTFRVACFAMICHHCGERYIEFFPDAKQEHLLIGMIHAFIYMGIPETVLTDNMKSVTTGRDPDDHPIWQKDYEEFMNVIGFKTKLCKVAHPFTKGKVERLVRFVKENFMAGRVFSNITDLNYEALKWCNDQNGRYHRAVDCVPHDKHLAECQKTAGTLTMTHDVLKYLCPLRKISFDGFVNYEGRRYGVPYWYTKKLCRVRRDAFTLYIYDDELTKELVQHNVTWSRKDSFCKDQYAVNQPEEYPSVPVKTTVTQLEEPEPSSAFEKFNFAKAVSWDE